jgi:hypothetical protein
VTVGVGSLLREQAQAEALPFVVRETGAPATRAQIGAEWQALSALKQNNYAAGHFRQYTELILPRTAIEDQLLDHLEEFLVGLRSNINDFDDYPEAARKAILDMTFNLGLAGVLNKFPSFVRAFRERNWAGCRVECNRRGIAEARNNYVKSLFDQCGAGS